ncbi:hypothetical protein PTTG_30810, partial [Puccinia triticina 1-1 BBBD Race 1]
PVAAKANPLIVDDKELSEAEVNRESRSILMAKIIKAEKTGDEEKVERYMKMYEAVLADKKTGNPKTAILTINPKIAAPRVNVPAPQTPTIPQKRPAEAANTTQVQTVKFIAGRFNSHDDGGFPPYFHKLLLECKGPLPLTIFNREWQERALAKHSKNQPKIKETAAEKGL